MLVVAGLVSTGLWLGAVQFPSFRPQLFAWPVLAGMSVCIGLTSANLMIRWFRWHFLIRRFSHHVTTRDSFAVYLATLPAIMTPFFVGELVRVLLMRRRFRKPAGYLARIWLSERLLDAGVLLTFHACTSGFGSGAAAAALLIAGALLLFRLVLENNRAPQVALATGTALLASFIAWSLPVVALLAVLSFLSPPAALGTAVRAFSAGTLFGGVTGLPMGVFVTGSTMIMELTSHGVPTDSGILTVLVYRAGTAWFAVVLGVVSLFFFRKRLANLIRRDADEHFDEIADDYQEEIPAHVRDRLLVKKVRIIETDLGLHGIRPRARGLDLGCGHGWYLAEFLRRGYAMDGVDYSHGQLRLAERHLKERGLNALALQQADAQALPFADDTFDFVYSINAFHHILAPGAQERALNEAVRVLRPGGVFILHEMNTNNPVFRLYMSYLFPLLKKIDEGNEEWLLPGHLPQVEGGTWVHETQYFTFLPDFVPAALQRLLSGVESYLERSSWRRFSAHYQACLAKRSLSSTANEGPAS